MQTVSELMTRDARFVAPQESLQRAAQMMDELDVGALPVCENGRLVGMVTDRDITIRATAAGRSPQEAHVDEVMSTDVRCCFEDQPLDEVMIQMADSRIRRVPVVSHDDRHKLIGIVSLGDVATRTSGAQKADVEQVVEMVSSPSEPGAKRSGSGANDVAGRTGQVSGAAAATTGTRSAAGTDLPRAGESGAGLGHGSIAGASGEPRNDAAGTDTQADAGTGDPRRNFGVGGQDLTQDGLPPA